MREKPENASNERKHENHADDTRRVIFSTRPGSASPTPTTVGVGEAVMPESYVFFVS